MQAAAELGHVTVLLMTDEAMRKYKRDPVVQYEHRKEILLAFRDVCHVIPCDGPDCYESIVTAHRPDVFMHGDDWKVGPQTEARGRVIDAVAMYGGSVVENQYYSGVSSTHLQALIKTSLDEHKKFGVLLRTVFNDLKRTPEVVARELSISESILNEILHGRELDDEKISKIISMLASYYPLDRKHLYLNKDKSIAGMWHHTNHESLASARVFDRCNAEGVSVPYYRYMDTAMTSLAPFKPELIEMLVQVEDNSATNANVVMNKGHLLAQLTFFIGPVNFYCTIRGKHQCVPMNTGDSCIITPFVPHSFTTRDSSQYSAIVAVTFSTCVRDALPDLVLQDTQKLLSAAGDARDSNSCRLSRIRRAAELRGMQLQDLDSVLSLDISRAEQDTILSRVLNVPVSSLSVHQLREHDEVQYAFGSTNPGVSAYDSFKKPLASAMHMPDCGGFEWQIKGEDVMESHFFCYIYNHGDVTLNIETETEGVVKSILFAPGDSLVLKPFVKLGVIASTRICAEMAKVVVVKVAGCVGLHALNEMATFADEGRVKMTSNLAKWW